IVTYVVDGALEHKDSLGTGSVIHPGEVQRMTAGTGVTHSEYNSSRIEPVHFLQIWILPERQGLAPGYEQRPFPAAEMQGRLRVVASPDGRDGSLTVHQDARILAARLAPGDEIVHSLAPGTDVARIARNGPRSGDCTPRRRSPQRAGDRAAAAAQPRVSLPRRRRTGPGLPHGQPFPAAAPGGCRVGVAGDGAARMGGGAWGSWDWWRSRATQVRAHTSRHKA